MPPLHKRLAVAGVLAFVVSAGAAQAQDLAQDPGTDSAQDEAFRALPSNIIQQFRPGIAIEQVIAQALGPIRQFDLDGNGLDAADIDTAEAIDRAGARAGRIGSTLRSDLDGDLKVTEAELRTTTARQFNRMQIGSDVERQAQIEQQVQRAMALDQDGDGALSIAEMAGADKAGADQRRSIYDSLRQIVRIDPNGDGHVTPAELEGIVRTAFAKIDHDGDGQIDQDEYAAYRGQLEQIKAALRYAGCTLPKASAGEALTLLGMYDGDSQPTVTVAGQDDVTSMARIVIEPGADPLYVVVTSYAPMIWKFAGETSRLKHVAVLVGRTRGGGGWAGAGVLGLAKELVTFVPDGTCGNTYKLTTPDGKAMAAAVAKAAGVASAHPVYVYAAEAVSLPGGQAIKASKAKDVIISENNAAVLGQSSELVDGGLSPAFQENWLAKPGGIVAVEPNDVVAAGKVEPYQVIPGQIGLRKLVEEGTLERLANGYRVIKPLARWPAGLSGSHFVKFYLPKDMPMPAGSPGHSQVIREP